MGASPHDQLTSGSASGPRWRLRPHTPRSPCPPLYSSEATDHAAFAVGGETPLTCVVLRAIYPYLLVNKETKKKDLDCQSHKRSRLFI